MNVKNASSSPQADWVRKLSASTFNYWAGYAANIILVLWLLSRAFNADFRTPLGTAQWLESVGVGLILWTFLEYLLHRYAYHEVESALKVGHGLHHDEPKALLGVPWYVTGIVLVGIYYGFAAFLSPAKTGVVMASAWAGYIGYCFVHHSVHHFNFKWKWFRHIRRHHLIHHSHPDKNWGMTTDVWDKVFRTKSPLG